MNIAQSVRYITVEGYALCVLSGDILVLFYRIPSLCVMLNKRGFFHLIQQFDTDIWGKGNRLLFYYEPVSVDLNPNPFNPFNWFC